MVAFVLRGAEHILAGADHLLFVAGLLLLAGGRARSVIVTITAFTAAHSLTLGMAAWGLVRINVVFVETLIGLSILWLALEIVRANRGGAAEDSQRPWRVAFMFGLLHGLGFAEGLAALHWDGPGALLVLAGFNIGVELGQLAFIVLLLVLARLIGRSIPARRLALRAAAVHAIGGFGVYWVLQRGSLLFV